LKRRLAASSRQPHSADGRALEAEKEEHASLPPNAPKKIGKKFSKNAVLPRRNENVYA